jgi:hypothetical protein
LTEKVAARERDAEESLDPGAISEQRIQCHQAASLARLIVGPSIKPGTMAGGSDR